MLNKGVRSEEDRRIESIVMKLSSIGFLPEDKEHQVLVDEELKKLGLSFEVLRVMPEEALCEHLVKVNFSWERMEEFADLLVQWSVKDIVFKSKGKMLYEFIQKASKSFSFERMQKISKLK